MIKKLLIVFAILLTVVVNAADLQSVSVVTDPDGNLTGVSTNLFKNNKALLKNAMFPITNSTTRMTELYSAPWDAALDSPGLNMSTLQGMTPVSLIVSDGFAIRAHSDGGWAGYFSTTTGTGLLVSQMYGSADMSANITCPVAKFYRDKTEIGIGHYDNASAVLMLCDPKTGGPYILADEAWSLQKGGAQWYGMKDITGLSNIDWKQADYYCTDAIAITGNVNLPDVNYYNGVTGITSEVRITCVGSISSFSLYGIAVTVAADSIVTVRYRKIGSGYHISWKVDNYSASP